jgi:hypothetical protein
MKTCVHLLGWLASIANLKNGNQHSSLTLEAYAVHYWCLE